MDGWAVARAAVVGLGAVWLGFALVVASDPVPDQSPLGPGLLLWGLVIGVSWVIYTVAWPGVFAARRRAAVWLAVPLLPVVAAHAGLTHWPLTVRVWLSESALIGQTTPRPVDPFDHVDAHKAEPKRIGSFSVYDVWQTPDEVTVFTTTPGLFIRGGLLHAPNGKTPDRVNDRLIRVSHLYGPWYRYAVPD